jgi:hypothetical protein
MSFAWALLALIALAAAATLALRAYRRALAAGLIGEICETLTLIESHDVEAGLARCSEALGDGGAAPNLPTLPTLSYRGEMAGMALIGAHRARLAAGFYAAAEALHGELSDLAAAAPGPARGERVRNATRELQRTFDLGDETLRALRDVIAPRRRRLLSRA